MARKINKHLHSLCVIGFYYKDSITIGGMIIMDFWNFDIINPFNNYFMTHINFTPFNPQPRPKNDFLLNWDMRYQFRHVWKCQMTCASELKPYFHKNEDLRKKIVTLSTEIGGFLKHSKWDDQKKLCFVCITPRIRWRLWRHWNSSF